MNTKFDREDVDPLVESLSNVEIKVNEVQYNIDSRLRPTLFQLNGEGEPSLTTAQNKSNLLIWFSTFNYLSTIVLMFYS